MSNQVNIKITNNNNIQFILNDKNYPIKCNEGVDHNDLINISKAPKFRDWLLKLINSDLIPHQKSEFVFEIIDISYFKAPSAPKSPNNVGFVYLKTNFAHPSRPDRCLPGFALIRGPTVAVLVEVIVDKCSYLVLVKQPRIPGATSACVELLAGMVDNGMPVLHAAMDELMEEAGIKADPKQIKILQSNVGVSLGGCDEEMTLCHLVLNMTDIEFELFRKKEKVIFGTGNINDDSSEFINLVIIPIDQWKEIKDMKLYASMALAH
jgi:hypothetical protein